jgi:hypothetical protein
MQTKQKRSKRLLLVAGAGLAAVSFSGTLGCGVNGVFPINCDLDRCSYDFSVPDMAQPADLSVEHDLAEPSDGGDHD